jgi:SAM-dependent methyltransferase
MRRSLRRRFEQAFWDLHSRGYDGAAESSGPYEREITEWIGDPPVDGGRVLVDLGCGTGRLLTALADAGWCVVGGDVSPGMLGRASSRISAMPMAGLVRLDLNQPLPFNDVNQVVLIHSLQAVRAPEVVLRRVHQILAPGGRVFQCERTAGGGPVEAKRVDCPDMEAWAARDA